MSKSVFKLLSVCASLTLLAVSTDATAITKSKAMDPEPRAIKIAPTGADDAELTEAEFAQFEKAAIDRGSRDLAASPTLNDDLLSDEFKKFRARFLAAKTPEQLDALLEEAQDDARFEKYPNDLKFFVAQATPLRAFKSIVYRIRPWVEKAAAPHSFALTSVRNLIAGADIYIPTDQSKALTAYLTEPVAGMGKELNDSDDVQEYLGSEVFAAMNQASKRLRSIKFEKPFAWDNQLLYGTASFADGLDRYRRIGQAELHATIAAVQGGLAQLSFGLAYSMTDFLAVVEETGELYGVDSFKRQLKLADIQGAPARERVKAVKEFPRFGVLKRPQYVEQSYKYFKNSVNYGVLAWQEIKGRPASKISALDPAIFNSLNRQMEMGAANLRSMVKGKTTVRSQVTGETVIVDLPKLFTNPPEDLKALLPTGFEGGPKTLTKKIGGKSYEYRNYREGRATKWNLALYNRYFKRPMNGKEEAVDNLDMPIISRIMFQAYGTTGVGSVLGSLIL